MSDMSAVIAAKSDQLNADDLLGGPITVVIRKVEVRAATEEQPVSVYYEGDNGKPWKPCKSMSRVMSAAWGKESKNYVGRKLTLFRDPSVMWAGIEVGGIRIAEMSHIEEPLKVVVNATRGKKKPYRVEPLQEGGQQSDNAARGVADDLIKRALACQGADALAALAAREAIIKRRDWLRAEAPDLADEVDDAFRIAQPADTLTPDNPTAAEGPSDDDRGEAHVDETPAWRAAVDEYLDRLTKVETLIDVKGAINQFAETKRALPDDVIADIEAAETNAQMRFVPATGG